MTGQLRLTMAALMLGVASSAMAQAPRIATPISDHAVLQRDRPIIVTGTAAPRERLTVNLGPRRATATADATGKWQARLQPLAAGGPYRLDVKGKSGTASADDLLIGDVWLCSGQSNMEYPLKAALNGDALVQGSADPEIRLLTMPHHVAFAPETALADSPSWEAAGPTSAADFSAACFLMVKSLKADQKVPMGAIDSSWGGTQIRPWIDTADARALPGMAADADLLALYSRDPAAAAASFARRWEGWWRERTGDAAGSEPWKAPDKRNWKPVPKIGFWEQWGVPELADFNGMVWFRKRVDLSAAPTGDAVLELGGIDELDTVWVNGVAVGSSFGWGSPRRYTVPAAALRAGANEIIVSVGDSYGPGGMNGPVDAMRLTVAGGATVPLGDGWRYSVQETNPGPTPRTPWESHAGLSTLYNGMIAPLGPIALKGAAWYQGESDTSLPGYDARMAALMAGWRRQFGDANLPFVIIGLANYGAPPLKPTESGWARVRDEQRRAAAVDGHAAIVTAVDIGEPTDIHPANKNDLAKRMARAATTLAYGGKEPPSGPLPLRAAREGGDVRVTFGGVTGALHAWSAASATGFELCAATDCRFAVARAEGNGVRLTGDGKPVDRVRYAWADAPVVNLFDEAPLPVVPFEMKVDP